MGRGLSQQQQQILGLAYTVNKYSQDGVARLKTGEPGIGFRDGHREGYRTIEYHGSHDLKAQMAIYAIAGIMPQPDVQNGKYAQTLETNKAKTSIIRAITRLEQREMLAYVTCNYFDWGYGYVLTAAGLETARQYELDVPALDDALCLFGLYPNHEYDPERESSFNSWAKRNHGNREAKRRMINRMIEANPF